MTLCGFQDLKVNYQLPLPLAAVTNRTLLRYFYAVCVFLPRRPLALNLSRGGHGTLTARNFQVRDVHTGPVPSSPSPNASQFRCAPVSWGSFCPSVVVP